MKTFKKTFLKRGAIHLMTILSVSGISCSYLAKNNSNREVASLSPSMQRGGTAQTKEDILQGLKRGSTVVSHVVYLENKKPVCYMPADSRLVPDFAKPQGGYSRGFSSKVTFKTGFPRCGSKQYNVVASAKNNFVPEGTQMAAVPLAIGGAAAVATAVSAIPGAISGCVIGTLERILDSEFSFIRATAAAIVGFLGGPVGAGAGVAGYAVCGEGVAYVLEDPNEYKPGAGCWKNGMYRNPCR